MLWRTPQNQKRDFILAKNAIPSISVLYISKEPVQRDLNAVPSKDGHEDKLEDGINTCMMKARIENLRFRKAYW
jgi:hypothetical protein